MSVATLQRTRAATDEIRRRRKCMQRAQTEVSIYTNIPHEVGLAFRGKVSVNDIAQSRWPKRKNVSSAGFFKVRANHPMAKLILRIPNTPEECKNVVVRVDKFGGAWRWTGMMHHWEATTEDGVDYVTAHFNDDMQVLQFTLGPPNPILPIPLFQGPRDYFSFGPGIWTSSTFLFLNFWRNQGNFFELPDDPFDLDQYDNAIDFSDWQVHIKCKPFLTDTSLWTFIGSRMNSADTVILDTLDDGQLCLDYRRIFTGEGETVDGLLDNNIANGALVFEITDRSGWTLPDGTFFDGTVVGGLARSVLTWTAGGVESVLDVVVDEQTLYPDEYWQSGFLGSFASAPTVGIADSFYNDLQSTVTHSPATAVKITVGGDNPTADAIAKLIIETVGNLLGYFLLFGFDSLGDIISDIVMPFLVGTILAWDQVKHNQRATELGWCHLWEAFQRGGEANSWSLAAIGAILGGIKATDAETSHTMILDESTWIIPGLHCKIGDRFWSTSGALERNAGIHLRFVNQIEEQSLETDDTGASRFIQKVGQNKAAMSTGERTANMFKRALTTLQDIGVRLIA
ncbi:minor tail protein [Mycobacterium phage Nairb]|uniref:Minor tail protein n=5 Tax=Bernalvirus bernal13 TaxID=1982102 RepID=A0A2P1JRN3_9CAUD|nr:minor tail protein [Mycobacterium phage Bernal13]AIT13432.1 minor tail protein [Mycobacterium phage RonRayGun]ASJ79100.1 minor tail protein [Mycobacterium phage ZenTime222]AVO21807.1 minor tail protein [Mycobacterium phage Nairb]QBP28864.1 minor tail protein [Mycobacterium phage Ibrahim]QHB47425.1 minor tail protein [Mycobacterium phage Whitty]